jgi:hypothetical protein
MFNKMFYISVLGLRLMSQGLSIIEIVKKNLKQNRENALLEKISKSRISNFLSSQIVTK